MMKFFISVAACILNFIIVAWRARPAWAEIPPSAYEKWRQEAPEILIIQIVGVSRTETLGDGKIWIDIVAEALVSKVERSRSRAKVNAQIEVRYRTFESTEPGWAGPGPALKVKEGKIYRVWLKEVEGHFEDAARGQSFEVVNDLETNPSTSNSLNSPPVSIRRAFAANLVPAAALWSFAGLLLLLYSFNPPTREVLNSLAELKNRLGLGFSMPAQAVAAGLIPFFFQRFQKGTHKKTHLRHVPYLMLCFACMGAVTDLFYMLQARLFGNGTDAVTVISKILVDMLIYCPVWSMPFAVLIFDFKDVGFSFKSLTERVSAAWYKSSVVPVWMAGLMVWTPTVAVIYSLPLPLQFPVQAIVTVLWGLILVILTSK